MDDLAALGRALDLPPERLLTPIDLDSIDYIVELLNEWSGRRADVDLAEDRHAASTADLRTATKNLELTEVLLRHQIEESGLSADEVYDVVATRFSAERAALVKTALRATWEDES